MSSAVLNSAWQAEHFGGGPIPVASLQQDKLLYAYMTRLTPHLAIHENHVVSCAWPKPGQLFQFSIWFQFQEESSHLKLDTYPTCTDTPSFMKLEWMYHIRISHDRIIHGLDTIQECHVPGQI